MIWWFRFIPPVYGRWDHGSPLLPSDLITPSAKIDAVSAQHQPTRMRRCPDPMRNAPAEPARQKPTSVPSGLRNSLRQTFLSG